MGRTAAFGWEDEANACARSRRLLVATTLVSAVLASAAALLVFVPALAAQAADETGYFQTSLFADQGAVRGAETPEFP